MRFHTSFSMLMAVLTISSCTALTVPSRQTTTRLTSWQLGSTSSSSDAKTTVDDIKADIARMRQEALQRLESLNEQMSQAEVAWKDQKETEQQTTALLSLLNATVDATDNTNNLPTIRPAPHAEDIYAFDEEAESIALLKARMERDTMHFVEPDVLEAFPEPAKMSKESPVSPKLLDETRWRLMLNVGRETGTWMPKTWGASGERLRMHLELEFTSDQLYEREEFLNGVSGAKVLKVVHAQGELAPSMQEGGRTVRLGPMGGWRVAPHEGPLGTSVLRFYFDLEEEVRHKGSDVYCPLGRIYCTCGYFPMADRHQPDHVSERDAIKEEMRRLEAQYEALAVEQEVDTDLVSWTKFQRSKRMMDLRMRATKLNTKMHEAQIREPDKSLLRLSQDQEVGLTREGGVCCKVHKGLAIEYHILGKFEIASMTNREHKDYRDLLP